MHNYFRNTIIVVLLSFFVTTSLWAQMTLSGPRVAKIIVPRAVVYADENLISPLGYISNGKIIAVGNPRKANRDIVPTVISGRIAYLELTDIEYQEEKIEDSKVGALKEHNVDIVLVKPEEKLNENNSALISLSRFGGGSALAETINTLEDKNISWFTSLNVTLVHRKPLSRFFYGIGWEYDFLSAADANIGLFVLNPHFGFTPMRNPVFSVDVFGNLDFSTGSITKVDNNLADDPTGFIWGPQIGIRIISAPNVKYRLFGILSYRYYKVYGMSSFKKSNSTDPTTDDEVTGFEKIQGVNIGAGLSFDL